MRSHVLLRSKYLANTVDEGQDKVVKNYTEEYSFKPFNGNYHEYHKEEPEARLGTYLKFVRTELKKWGSEMEKRTMIEELVDLASVDATIEHVEKDMKRLFLDHPEVSLE